MLGAAGCVLLGSNTAAGGRPEDVRRGLLTNGVPQDGVGRPAVWRVRRCRWARGPVQLRQEGRAVQPQPVQHLRGLARCATPPFQGSGNGRGRVIQSPFPTRSSLQRQYTAGGHVPTGRPHPWERHQPEHRKAAAYTELTYGGATHAHADMSTRAVYLRWCPWNEVNDGQDYVPGWPRMFPAPPRGRTGPRVRTVGWILIACLSLFALTCLVIMVRHLTFFGITLHATHGPQPLASLLRARQHSGNVGISSSFLELTTLVCLLVCQTDVRIVHLDRPRRKCVTDVWPSVFVVVGVVRVHSSERSSA